MAAITTFCCNLPFNFLEKNLPEQRNLKNPTSFSHAFSPPRSIFSAPRKPVLRRNNGLWVPNSMDESVRTSAFRDRSNTDENIRVLEQEAFVDGSSESRPKFLFNPELETTLNRVSKWIVTALFGGFILWKHDAEALWFAAGSVLNAMLSVSLKQILNQERPSSLKSDPGMPSSHSQSIFFTVLFVILSNVGWLGLNEITIAISTLTFALGTFFSYLRVSHQLHTVSQVVVGAVIGSVFSILWYWLWNAFVLDAFVASLWVRIIVVLGCAGACLGFVLFAIRHWFNDE